MEKQVQFSCWLTLTILYLGIIHKAIATLKKLKFSDFNTDLSDRISGTRGKQDYS